MAQGQNKEQKKNYQSSHSEEKKTETAKLDHKSLN